ncbi:uncharacterized protein BP5553_10045 [Venustampulla echinocandica]|uniref:Uncharacterized protein n=1 Tax=Venustampulla echinocandica TaxID=2656787 RepID=A0A370TA94_9HELO|nr:uncharacterized protein BP5553_10045 [Venustampulla echinocandica]RDL30700.1 hypothetical protein BP5553_10045 [Venustampulla echinocandica]
MDTQTCYSSLGTSRAYASAEALNNNIDDFCQDIANKVPLITIGWTRSKTYYPNTPEEYTMTVALSYRAFSFNQYNCTDAMSSIINGCDVPVGGYNPMNWKQGGKRVQGKYTYQIDIFRQNRPWPPPAKPTQSCEGWYKFILQHYDIYGAGWANYDWGQKSLMRAINPCCGLGSLTGWNFKYFDQPDKNGYETLPMEEPIKYGGAPNKKAAEPVKFDFSPFLSAPAISETVKQVGSLQPVYIPETLIPSPFAPNIRPNQLFELKYSLYEEHGNVKGKEIWISWKRAWDVWNNHYIEGRVNQEWVKGELERREKELKSRRRKKKTIHPSKSPETAQKIPKVYTTFAGDNPPSPDPGTKWVKARNTTEVITERKIMKKTGRNVTVKRMIKRLRTRPGGVITYRRGSRRPLMKKVKVEGVEKWVKSDIYQYVKEDTTEPGHEVEIYDAEKYVEIDEELEEVVPEVRTVSAWELVDDFDNPAPSPSYEDEDEWPSHVEDGDGWSGGFLGMKNFIECKQTGFDDLISNAVWVSRRVGEKTVDVTHDKDIESFLRGSDLEVDGGIDCRHSPHPVLRWAINYIRTENGLFRKKKGWDGVTGTIFNLPTGPPESEPHPSDERLSQIRSKPAESKIFPLDIRRVDSVLARNYQPICHLNEEILDFDWDMPGKREMKESDPWWVTPDQERKREISSRQGMPWKPRYKNNVLLPYDEVNWLDNRLKDDVGDSKYFVTNLHGGTLIVNGQEVKRGRVAGPLPKFAVIECPGHQVAFWWGIGGRTLGQGPNEPQSPGDWESMRVVPGWEHCGKTAGEVWDAMIIDRMKRVAAGEGPEPDDEQWEAWKNYQPPPPQDIPSIMPSPTVPFATEEEELKWIAVQSELMRNTPPGAGNEEIVEPSGDKRWPGPIPELHKPQPRVPTQEEREAIWAQKGEALIAQQIQLVRKLGISNDDDKHRILRERKRRRVSDVNNPEPKRLKSKVTLPIAPEATIGAVPEGGAL